MLSKVRKPDQAAIKASLHRIMNAAMLPAAWSAARRFADRWASIYPKAACLRADLDDLLACLRYSTLEERKTIRTTDEIDKVSVSEVKFAAFDGRGPDGSGGDGVSAARRAPFNPAGEARRATWRGWSRDAS